VLTGGSSKMEGVVELAEEVFHMPVRLGVPQQVKGLYDVVRNPIHATGVGLLRYGLGERGAGRVGVRIETKDSAGLLSRMKAWFQGNF
jgi:cell division protein FtsA